MTLSEIQGKQGVLRFPIQLAVSIDLIEFFSFFHLKMLEMSKLAILLFGIVFIAVVMANQDQDAWSSFKQEHNKHYKNAAEEQKRKQIFEDNLKEVNEHNEQFKAGKVTYQKGLNEYSDLTNKEFQSRMTGYIPIQDDDSKDQGNPK